MKWVLAFHIISMVAWFAGLFYLPRLFVYHTATTDQTGYQRFLIMEHKLYYYIMTPSAITTSILGFWLLYSNPGHYETLLWMHLKLILVLILWIYHIHCGVCLHNFKQHRNGYSQKFYRFYNEIPTLLLIAIIILVEVKPFSP